MPAFGDSYRTNSLYQQRNLPQQQQQQQNQNPSHQKQIYGQHPHYITSQRSISPPDVTSSFSSPAGGGNSFGGVAAQLSTVPGVGSGVRGTRHRIYPKELNNSRSFFNKNASNSSASPLLSAFANPADLFSRSIPSFISSSPGTGSSAQSSLAGSPPSSWPTSYTNGASISKGIGGSVPQQRGNGAYPSVEEQLSRNGGFLPHPRTGVLHGGLGSERQLTPGEVGYVCSFDTLDGESENVICMGWEGGVDVWKVGKGMLDLLGKLEGLSGGVRGAKILPTPQRSDPLASLRPLIVLTLHSPIYNAQEDSASPAPSPPTSRPQSAASFSSTRSHRTSYPLPQKHPEEVEWQTSVEIYSLYTRERVAVLFTSPPVSNYPLGDSQCPPPAWGNIRLEVGESTVAVGIGMSGEVYLFRLMSIVGPSDPSPPDENPAEPVPVAEIKKARKIKKKQETRSPPKDVSPVPTQLEVTSGEWVCHAKVWTTVQLPSSGTDNSGSSGFGVSGIGFYANGIAVFSLQGRWLAYVPPPANSSLSAGGHVRVPLGTASSLVHSQAPPSPPSISAFIDMADGEEKLLNRLTREGIQEGIRVAKWVGEHGMRAIQNYWSGSNGNGGSEIPPPASLGNGTGALNSYAGIGGHPMARGNSGGMSGLGQQIQREKQLQQQPGYPASMGSPYLSSTSNLTPSTYSIPVAVNGAAPAASQGLIAPHQPGGYLRSAMHGANDAILVSLLDIGRFPTSNANPQSHAINSNSHLSPFATFQPPLGVSYVSLAPGGLALLTVSSKGDVYYIWDLLRLLHQKPNNAASNAALRSASAEASSLLSSKHVRQIARFSRLTVAHTVDAVWSYPRGDKLAILTDKGTVHFYDLPSNAYQWPPYKKPPPISLTGKSPAFNAQQQAAGAVQAVQGAVGLLNSTAQPLLTAARRRSSTSGLAGKGPSPPGGINVSYIRYKDKFAGSGGNGDGKAKAHNAPLGITKISLPGHNGATAGSVKFLMGKELGYVGMMGGGSLVIYQKTSGGQGGSKKRRSINAGGILPETGVVYELPVLPDGTIIQKRDLLEEESPEVEKIVGGFWNGKTHHSHHRQYSVLSGDYYRKRDEQQQYEMHPLAFAEIDTNPDYVALHEDRRVTLMVFADSDAAAPTTSSVILHATQQAVMPLWDTQRADNSADKDEKWVFGLPIQVEKLNLGRGKGEVEFCEEGTLDDVVDAMESRLRLSTEIGERVATGKMEEGIFENDCEVLDYRM